MSINRNTHVHVWILLMSFLIIILASLTALESCKGHLAVKVEVQMYRLLYC